MLLVPTRALLTHISHIYHTYLCSDDRRGTAVASLPKGVLNTIDVGVWKGLQFKGERIPLLSEFLQRYCQRSHLQIVSYRCLVGDLRDEPKTPGRSALLALACGHGDLPLEEPVERAAFCEDKAVSHPSIARLSDCSLLFVHC
jgi:hypothetical protein